MAADKLLKPLRLGKFNVDKPRVTEHHDEAVDLYAIAKHVFKLAPINLPNLTEHISAARDLADIIVRKRGDHAIAAIEERP